MVDPVKLEHFRNLVSLSAADGEITEPERNALYRIASAIGIPHDRLEIMLSHAHEYMYLVPQNTQDRHQQLDEMIDLAWVDGEFSRAEQELVRSVARKLGFTDEETQAALTRRTES